MNTLTTTIMRRHTSAVRRSRVIPLVATAMLAVVAAAGCGSPSTGTDSLPGPAATASEPAGPPDGAGPGTASGSSGPGTSADQGGVEVPAQPPLVIEVTTELPTASHPCQPSGSIVVSGGSDGGDSAQLPESDEYPVGVTYQWFVRKSGPEPNPVPFGLPGTLQFNVAGGVPVSSPALTPAPGHEVELRVVAPETISGGWVAYSGCV